MYRHGLSIAVALFAWALATSASADIWKWVDSDGHVQYSDRWTPGAVLIKGEHPSNATDQKQPPSDSDKRITDQLNREEAQRQVQKDEAAAHADQCKKATDHYNQLVSARRIYNTDSNGERQYLSDQQADQERVDAKMDMDTACSSASQ
jgi:Domain of unknown function (DUF4124)